MDLFAKNNPCEQKTIPINRIQGDSQNSPMINQEVWVKGVVTGDFRGKDRLGGYFLQSSVADNNSKTSEGIFVMENNLQLPIGLGDVVVTKGEVTEQFGVTQIKHAQFTRVCDQQQLPQPFVIKLPLNGFDLERIEGMRVTFDQPQTITEINQMISYGEIMVSNGMLMNPTAVVSPGKAVEKVIAANRQNQMIIDDGSLNKFVQPLGQRSDLGDKISATNLIKIGQTINATGVMHYAFGKYKLQPTEPLALGQPLASSLPQPPELPGQIKIAAFNIENYFTTLDQGKEICGPLQNFSCRGADNKTEFKRQTAKIVHAINTADADVIGLQELENNKTKSIKTLVEALNKAAGFKKWDFVDTGILGKDAIKVGFIYQPEKLKKRGDFALLNSKADPEFLENRNRIIVAQTFADSAGHSFNVATVHFKSKSCRDAEGTNMNQQDGQSCYNPVRVQVAEQLSRWLKTDPTGQGAAATFIVGDFNSYQLEDPMVKLKSMGFMNLADDYLPPQNWTASFRGTVGSLDYVLANEAGRQLTKGLVQWHINSTLSDDFGYNNEPLDKGVEKPAHFYREDPYVSSDHDIVMAGISFD